MRKIRPGIKYTLLGILALLLAARMILPAVIKNAANDFLADYSKVFTARIGDVDLSFLRMAYRFENVEVQLREDKNPFFQVDGIDVSLAWRELFRGRVLTDIEVWGAKFHAANNLIPAMKRIAAENAGKADAEEVTVKKKLFPYRVERLVLRDSNIDYAAEPGAPEDKRLRITELQTRLSNLNPADKTAKTLLTLQATLMDSAKVKAVGNAKFFGEKVDWDMDMEMRNFELAKVNPFTRNIIPFTFTAGTMDLFAEAKSEKNKLEGYVKPFLKKVDVVENRENFQGPKHFLFEIVGATANLILRRPKVKSMATKVNFAGEGADIKVDIGSALANAVEHRIDEPINPAIEDQIQLK